MDVFGRYRNLVVLVGVLFAQILGLAVQVRRTRDSEPTRLIRIWAVGAVTPLEKALSWAQTSSGAIWHNYFYLRGVRAENRELSSKSSRCVLSRPASRRTPIRPTVCKCCSASRNSSFRRPLPPRSSAARAANFHAPCTSTRESATASSRHGRPHQRRHCRQGPARLSLYIPGPAHRRSDQRGRLHPRNSPAGYSARNPFGRRCVSKVVGFGASSLGINLTSKTRAPSPLL